MLYFQAFQALCQRPPDEYIVKPHDLNSPPNGYFIDRVAEARKIARFFKQVFLHASVKRCNAYLTAETR